MRLKRFRHWPERVDEFLIAEGYPADCVAWVCDEHSRHCTRIGTEHAEHACWICEAEEDR